MSPQNELTIVEVEHILADPWWYAYAPGSGEEKLVRLTRALLTSQVALNRVASLPSAAFLQEAQGIARNALLDKGGGHE